MPKGNTFEAVLNAWATQVPNDMADECAKDKILDSFLRLFESLSANKMTHVPTAKNLIPTLRRAIHWQWIALSITAPPWVSAVAPHVLTLAAMRWFHVWKTDKTLGNARLMAVIDKDLGRMDAAMRYLSRTIRG